MLVGMVCDVMTHSQARGRGVFTELGRYALAEMAGEGLSFVTGYPIRPEVMGGHLRAGWEVAFQLPMYLRPLRSRSILAPRKLSWAAPVVDLGLRALNACVGPRSKLRCEVGRPEDLLSRGATQSFLERWGATVPNHLVKSPEFYAWRLGAPETSYRVFVVRDSTEEISARAIARAAPLHGVPSLAVLDMMVLPGRPAAGAALVRGLVTEARAGGADALVTMMSAHSARRHRLGRLGFLRTPYVFKLIVRSLDPSLQNAALSREADWDLMWIDSDDL
jgi:hypothetical protein